MDEDRPAASPDEPISNTSGEVQNRSSPDAPDVSTPSEGATLSQNLASLPAPQEPEDGGGNVNLSDLSGIDVTTYLYSFYFNWSSFQQLQ